MKKKNRFLSIKGAVLDNEQLGIYMEKMAASHDLNASSKIETYPIPRLKENLKFIEKTYNLLNKHIEMDIDIYPAGEWLLDNFYAIEETVQTVVRELTPKKYKSFPGLIPNGYSRICLIATEMVSYTDGRITEDVLNMAIISYQKRKTLSMEEIWSLWCFLSIALIEDIRNICEKIYSAQMQKYKVESILERLVEKKDSREQKFKNAGELNASNISYKEMKYPFIEYMSYRLKQYGRKALPYLNILEEQVNKMGMTISEVIQKEHFDIAVR